jgi:ubiquitin-conjugating enzyme E2 variant
MILSRQRHALHHRAPCVERYCITTGWLNPVLDRVAFWRTLERGVTRATGAVPRAGDPGPHEARAAVRGPARRSD